MTHEDKGHFSKKHSPDRKVNARVSTHITTKVTGGRAWVFPQKRWDSLSIHWKSRWSSASSVFLATVLPRGLSNRLRGYHRISKKPYARPW